MRFLLFVFLIISGCTCVKAANDTAFAALSKSATAVIQGKIIRNVYFVWDLGTLEGSFDIQIERICYRDAKQGVNTMNVKINDTLRNIKYVADMYQDTLSLNKSYLFPLLVDSFVLFNKSYIVDFNAEVFDNISLLEKYCSKIIVSNAIKQADSGKKTKNITYYDNGKKREKIITKNRSDGMIITKTITWNDNGKKISHTRRKGRKYYKGSRTVVWTFRSGGRLCLSRGIQILK